MIENFFKSEESDFKSLIKRLRKRDFQGNTGQAIKNSTYQFATNVLMKAGSLIFTIIVARMLLPELFGLYSLALSTIILFAAFSDFGIGSAIVTFIPKMLAKKDEKKAKAYTKKLLKWKTWLLIISSVVLIASSYFVANYYYNKPIFFALIAGGLYIPFMGLTGFIEQIFKANNLFREPAKKEIIFQLSRVIIVPLIIFFALNASLKNELTIFFVILGLSLSYLMGGAYLLLASKKKIHFLKSKNKSLNNKESKDLKKFLIPLTATALSGIFFGYIDTIMLGHFVESEYISLYSASLSIVGSVSAIIGFSAISLFPIFSKLKGASLERLFKKGRNFTALISFFSAIVVFFLAEILVKIAYGNEYLGSVTVIKILGILIFVIPLVSIYNSYFISTKKTKIVAKLLIFTTILNIILNYTFISYGLTFGQFEAVLGACGATIISQFFYLGGLIWIRKK
ncbi:MAG: flippase [Nanoarchaeota archaeon]|nr:flippase [Nanoarchaeota archaeon]